MRLLPLPQLLCTCMCFQLCFLHSRNEGKNQRFCVFVLCSQPFSLDLFCTNTFISAPRRTNLLHLCNSVFIFHYFHWPIVCTGIITILIALKCAHKDSGAYKSQMNSRNHSSEEINAFNLLQSPHQIFVHRHRLSTHRSV